MTGQYLGNDLQWRPIATVSGGGPVEKLPLDASLGSSTASALVRAVGDEVWDFYEPLAGGVSLSYAFRYMSRITTVPAFDTSAVTDMSGMFYICSSLVSVPAFNTSRVTTMGAMFYGCSSLVSVPAFNTSRVTNMASMFGGCRSLDEVPAIGMAAVTSLGGAFGSSGNSTGAKTSQLQSCTRFLAYGATRGFTINGTQMDATALNELMENLGTAAGTQTLDLRYNPGSATCAPGIATAKGWTVST